MKTTLLMLIGVIIMSTQCVEMDVREKVMEETTECIDPNKIDKEAPCYMIYKPVCGCDGKTYSNDCVAQNSGVLVWTEGECDQ